MPRNSLAEKLLPAVDLVRCACKAVLVMMCVAVRAATSAGSTTRLIGVWREPGCDQFSNSSPRRNADNDVSTQPAAMRLTRRGAS